MIKRLANTESVVVGVAQVLLFALLCHKVLLLLPVTVTTQTENPISRSQEITVAMGKGNRLASSLVVVVAKIDGLDR